MGPERTDRGEYPVDAAQPLPALGPDVVPAGQERRKSSSIHRLDLVAQEGYGAPLDHPQHVGVAPLGSRDLGQEAALDEPPLCACAAQPVADHRRGQPEIRAHLLGPEWSVGPGEAGHQVVDGVRHGLQVRLGKAGWQRRTHAVAQPRGVLDCRPDRGARQPGAEHPALGLELVEPVRAGAAQGGLLGAQGA